MVLAAKIASFYPGNATLPSGEKKKPIRRLAIPAKTKKIKNNSK